MYNSMLGFYYKGFMGKKNRQDHIGKKYNKLTVWAVHYKPVNRTNGEKCEAPYATCVCECGGFREVTLGHLTSGNTTSCGCSTRKSTREKMKLQRKFLPEDFIGKKFNNLVVLGEIEPAENDVSPSKRVVACVCACGNLCAVPLKSVKSGNKKSCGCARLNIPESHRHTTEMFVELAKLAHGDSYGYEYVDFISDKEKVNIFCKVPGHGIFRQNPANHKQGYGCHKCRKAGFNTTLPGQLYVLVSPTMTKIGITNGLVKLRCNAIKSSSKIDFEVAREFNFEDGQECEDIEKEMLSILRASYESPKNVFDGYTECFFDVDIEMLFSEIGKQIKEYRGDSRY